MGHSTTASATGSDPVSIKVRILVSQPMKKCTSCHEFKPYTGFNLRRSATDGRQDRCRDCSKVWYSLNAVKHKKRVRIRNNRVIAEHRGKIRDYLRTHPCVDCGETDVVVLEFDHVRGKKLADVSRLVSNGSSWTLIEKETSKCDVRCANDHKRVTLARREGSKH